MVVHGEEAGGRQRSEVGSRKSGVGSRKRRGRETRAKPGTAARPSPGRWPPSPKGRGFGRRDARPTAPSPSTHDCVAGAPSPKGRGGRNDTYARWTRTAD